MKFRSTKVRIERLAPNLSVFLARARFRGGLLNFVHHGGFNGLFAGGEYAPDDRADQAVLAFGNISIFALFSDDERRVGSIRPKVFAANLTGK